MMDHQTLINVILGVLLAAGGWFCRQIWDAVKELRADLHRIEVDLPINYIRRDEFSDGMREIKEMLGKIFDKLDGKVDK
jgi:hypothetical protein